MGIITIDFEASCLPQRGPSYPIEVGIAGDGGPPGSFSLTPAGLDGSGRTRRKGFTE